MGLKILTTKMRFYRKKNFDEFNDCSRLGIMNSFMLLNYIIYVMLRVDKLK